ncbi:hypothetical protein ESP57_06330 [Agromyces fucosus]|uniref:TfoX N-terminal domain-containing protein n=1 Tax=Agromyces fucosus TaxID=41985 RepID=A0A4V1QSJ5_9MICO|nr:hypothetical protein [Agromyces fucosus]RXZ48613.1 hypothetical protein ESP57_06330 [Agromyces fucosus]
MNDVPRVEREAGRRRLDEMAPELLARPDVAIGRMFGSDGVSVRGKLFAFVANSGSLVVKLPEARIDELQLDNMVMRGRPMREWAVVPFDDGVDRWREIAGEAHAFVDSITP